MVVVRGVLGLLMVGLAGLGIALILRYPSTIDERDRYNALARCASAAAPIDSSGCWASRPARVTAVGETVTTLGARRDEVTVQVGDGGTASVEVPPTLAYHCTAPGDLAVLKFWHGDLTGVYTTHGLVPTLLNPNVGTPDELEAGVLLICVAAAVPVAAVVTRSRSLRRTLLPIGELARTQGVRVALVLFGAGQLADVVSSAVGQRAGLVESNPLLADFVRIIGPMGFLIFRLPIIVLALIAAFRLPRVILIGALLGGAVYFTAVGGHNLQLAFAAASPPACPVATLP